MYISKRMTRANDFHIKNLSPSLQKKTAIFTWICECACVIFILCKKYPRIGKLTLNAP